MSGEIKPNIFFVGAIDWDRKLFEELTPLPDGTSYNAYLIKGSEKTALIDTVDPTMTEVLLQHLQNLAVEHIDYVIANHAEQDHSGSLPKILELYPEAKVVTNQKCKEFLIELLAIPDEKFMVIQDKETLSLGDKTLEFLFAPWVHWPETMFTYLHEDKILFSGDFFGSHVATNELFVHDEVLVYDAAKRYYAEIMMPFRNFVKKHLDLVCNMDIEMIATTHGPVYDKPKFILDAYNDWAGDHYKNEVIIVYISMHGSIKKMVNYLIEALTKRDVPVKEFNLTEFDVGKLAIELVDAATLVIGSSVFLAEPHPKILYACHFINAVRPKAKYLGILGSFGWSGQKLVPSIQQATSHIHPELFEPVVVKGIPKEEDLAKLDALADAIAEKHKALK